MSTQLQLRRGTTAQHSTFTGASGEITIDTDKNVVIVHDGSTAGGIPQAKDSSVVHNTGNETISGTKTFSSTIQGSISGNADTLDGQHGSYYQPASSAITTSNIGSQSVNYATSAGSASSATNADTLDGNHASAFQAALVSGTNIKTINGSDLLGSGNLVVGGNLSTHIDQSALFSGSQTTLALPDISVMVGGTLVAITAQNVNLSTSGNWDNATYATAANRNGKDFYVYALQAGGFILSANSSYPAGYNSNNSRKIGGLHCLCVAVGTISGHTLTGYAVGDILPRSVWDRFNRSSARQEGTVLSSSGVWVDIYLPSVSGTTLVSVNGGTIADGASSPAFHCYKFEQWFARQGMKSISQLEFFAASQGANQSTNISGSSDPGTTSGHTDTAGRRMISNEGIEDLCGVLWQWTRDQGGNMTAASWANAYDGNDAGVGGQHYQAPYRGILGGHWAGGVACGSRGSFWSGSPLALESGGSGRGVAEPANSRF